MVERDRIRLWSLRMAFFGVCVVVIFWKLLPLDALPRAWAGPDLIVALSFAWVLRRPEYAPPVLIAIILLLADFLFQRPPGLWAALVLLGSEALKSRAPLLRDMTFVPEWLTVTVVLVVITLSYRLIMAVLLLDQAPLGLHLLEMVMTLLAYPLVVFASAVVLGIRKIKAGDAESLGLRT